MLKMPPDKCQQKKKHINEGYTGDRGHALSKCKMNAEMILQNYCLDF